MDINTKTFLYGIIGKPIGHSLSPYLHNYLFQYYKLNAVYLAFETDDVKNAIAGMKSLGIQGFSVTIPNKVSVLEYLDELDESVKIVGAVNTIKNNNNFLIGYNTDVFGVFKSFQIHNVDCNNKKIVIIGSGGACRAVISALISNYKISEIKILGIKLDEINDLLNLIKLFSNTYSSGYIINDISLKNSLFDADIIINTSPIGMSPKIDESPIPFDLLPDNKIVFDVVYNPIKTKLLQFAEQKKCKIISGLDMFKFQAQKQFQIFSNIEPDIEIITNLLASKIK